MTYAQMVERETRPTIPVPPPEPPSLEELERQLHDVFMKITSLYEQVERIRKQIKEQTK